MSHLIHLFRRALLCASIVAALAVPVMGSADAPDRAVRPDARPDPAAEWRDRQRAETAAEDAYERELREDWLDWQRDRGGTYREFLRERQEAKRRLREKAREERLERLSPERDVERLGERLEAQRQESFDRLEERTPQQRLRPDTLRRNRPGLRN